MKHRIDWDGHQNIVVIDTEQGGHVELTLEDFVRLADKVITGTFEPTNPGFKKSFRKLPGLVSSFDRQRGSRRR